MQVIERQMTQTAGISSLTGDEPGLSRTMLEKARMTATLKYFLKQKQNECHYRNAMRNIMQKARSRGA